MERTEALEKLLRSFKRYYNVKTEDVTAPFDAEAEFVSNDTQYFLLKAAKLSESESHEYVYFALREKLDPEELEKLDEAAWETCLKKAQPKSGHRNTDATLIILADCISQDAKARLSKLNHYKSYKFGLWGFSQYRLVALELSTGCVSCNRLGRNLEKLVSDIM